MTEESQQLGNRTPNTEAAPTVFASHSSKDRAIVEEFIRQFEGTEIGFWLEEAEIRPGAKLRKAIREGIRESGFLGLFLTPDSVSSGWVQKEIQWAEQESVPVVAIRLANAEVPEELREVLFIDVSGLGHLTARNKLLSGLRRGLEEDTA